MGLVVAATHLQLEQTVALKFFRGELGSTGEPLMRFMREARAAAQLKSEYVARVLDVGITEDGTPYMVMEYLEGHGVERVIAAEGPMDVTRAAEYGIQACEGLAEAHGRGIVHRDIKPSNLFLTERSPNWRSIKILDFGISKVSLAQASNITTSLNIVMGTPCYMSPEQFQSAANVDHRTDIWSLGATLYEMLLGSPPFDPSLPLLAIAEEIVNKDVPSLHALRPEVPQELADLIGRCMTKNREHRIPSAAALAMGLLPFAPQRARSTAERAAAMTPAFGMHELHPRAMVPGATPGSPNTMSGMWTQIGFASPTPQPTGENALMLPPPSGAAAAPSTGIVEPEVDRASRGWQSSTLAVVISASLLVCAVVYLALVRATPAPPRRSALTMVPSVPIVARASSPTTTTAAANAPTLSELTVRVSPPSAQIMIDGSMVAGNPFRGQFHRGTHQIQAFAAGYEPKVQQASLATDVILDFSLDRRSKTAAARPSYVVAQPRSASPAPASAADSPMPGPSRPSGRTPPLLRQAALGRSPETQPLRIPPARSANQPSPEIVDVRGGRAPLHPIETHSPYLNP
jgi:serine/threonine protein kinase